jgi:hypothetical protein
MSYPRALAEALPCGRPDVFFAVTGPSRSAEDNFVTFEIPPSEYGFTSATPEHPRASAMATPTVTP